MWAQTLVLALRQSGLGSCLQVSVVGYPEVLRRELGIDEHMTLLCGIAIGWPEDRSTVNTFCSGRESFEKHLVWNTE